MVSMSNKHSTRLNCVRFAACVSSVFLISFVAGDVAFAGEVTLEEIMVTAQKREQSVFDVPISIGVLGSEEIEARGVGDLVDLAYAIPELTVIEGFPGSNFVFIRGLGSLTMGSSFVGTYLDEYAVSISGLTGMNNRVVDLERAEVLRGPQGTLYGQGSLSGTVRLVPKAPELDRFGVKGDVSFYLSEDSDELGERISGMINIPVVEDVLGLRIAGEYENTGGWADHPEAGRKDVNDRALKNLHVKGLWRPNNVLEVKSLVVIDKMDADSSNDNIDEDRNLLVFAVPTEPLPAELNTEIYGLTVAYDFGPMRLLSVSSYYDYDNSVSFSSDFGIFTYDGRGIVKAAKAFTQELRFNSAGEGSLDWTVGLFYRDFEEQEEVGDNAQLADFGEGPVPFLGYLFETKRTAWALFGDASYALTERFELGAGIRYFDGEYESSYAQGAFNAQGEGNSDKITWRTYLSFDLTEEIKTYASVATGFRSGGTNIFVPNAPTYDPDELLSYEVGAKASFLDGVLTAELALFYSEYQDLQAIRINPPNPAETYNVGEAEVKGLDWTFIWHPLDALALSIAGNVIDSEISKLSVTSTKLVGDSIDFVPNYTYTLSADYSFNWMDSVPGFVRLDFNEQGKMSYIDRTQGVINDSDTLQFLNFRLGAEWKQWTIAFYAKNLLDEEGKTMANTLNRGLIGRRPNPRTIGIKAGLEFN